ncbi:MAG: DivIVA domain-containing protein [Acidimicrobiales bacterium]
MAPVGITAQDIRRVEFRERLRGYHQADVDEFLERVAAAVEKLEEQLRRTGDAVADDGPATGPVARGLTVTPLPKIEPVPISAPTRAGGVPGSEHSLRRTLELAQRAADLAVQEAREQGAAIVASAEASAATLVAEADERARTLADDAQRDLRAEVARLEASRDQLRAELDVLARVVDGERERGRAWLAEVAAAIDRPALQPTPDQPLEPAAEAPALADGPPGPRPPSR